MCNPSVRDGHELSQILAVLDHYYSFVFEKGNILYTRSVLRLTSTIFDSTLYDRGSTNVQDPIFSSPAFGQRLTYSIAAVTASSLESKTLTKPFELAGMDIFPDEIENTDL